MSTFSHFEWKTRQQKAALPNEQKEFHFFPGQYTASEFICIAYGKLIEGRPFYFFIYFGDLSDTKWTKRIQFNFTQANTLIWIKCGLQ